MKMIALLMMAVDLNGQPLPDVVLLDFTAGYCQPCRQMVPVLQRMEKLKYPIRKIDITEHPDVTRQYNVDRIPTLILLVEGKEVQRFQGVRAEAELRQAMNDAARTLEQKRQKNAAPGPAAANNENNSPATEAETAFAEESKVSPKPGGFKGFFDKMRNGFRKDPPEQKIAGDSFPPEFRAQSPENTNPPETASPAMQATVRVRLMDGNLRDVGTGTIIQSTPGQSIILTCNHIFLDVKDQAIVEVDVFRNGKVLKYPAQVLGGDHESDVAFLRINNTTILPTAPLAADDVVKKNAPLFSIGCSNGDVPTRLNMNVIDVNRYNGPGNILCTNDPAKGRSGGGLFDAANRIVGVCSAADREAREGLYTSIKPIRKLMAQLNMNAPSEQNESVFAAADPAPAFDNMPSSPFSEDKDVFDEFFAEETTLNEFVDDSDAAFGQLTRTQPATPVAASPHNLPDPFGTATTMTASTAGNQPANQTELTVIIDDPNGGRRMVVIPKPSPWLLELLTGDKTGSDTSVTASRQRTLSATSARRSAR